MFPSQANFLLVRMKPGVSGGALCAELLRREAILIKDISGKFNDGADLPAVRGAVAAGEREAGGGAGGGGSGFRGRALGTRPFEVGPARGHPWRETGPGDLSPGPVVRSLR